MKKFLSTLLAFAMVLSLIPISCVTAYAENSGICSEHLFGEWELVRLVSCTNAGTREREVRKCLNCGKKEYRFTGNWIYHDWSEWVIVREASCTLWGEEYRYCNICDEEQQRFPEATGHNYEVVVVNPTCTEQGYTEYICKCGDTYTDNFIEATGHDKNAEGFCDNCNENLNPSTEQESSSAVNTILQMIVDFINLLIRLFK